MGFEPVFELQEVEVAKKQPFGVFCGIFHLFERKYLIADKQNSKNGLIVFYVLFRELSIHVSSFY